MDGQIAQLIAYGCYTHCRSHECWRPRTVHSFFLRRSRSPATAMSSASSERELGALQVAATAAVTPPTGATTSTVAGDNGRPMTPPAAVPPSAESTPSQSLNASTDRLKLEQHRLKTIKKQIVKELRNAERKRKRLRERAPAHGRGPALGHVRAERKEKRNRRPQVAQKTQRATRTLARQSTALAPEPCAANHAQQRSPLRACLQHAWTRRLLQYCRPGPL